MNTSYSEAPAKERPTRIRVGNEYKTHQPALLAELAEPGGCLGTYASAAEFSRIGGISLEVTGSSLSSWFQRRRSLRSWLNPRTVKITIPLARMASAIQCAIQTSGSDLMPLCIAIGGC